MYAALRCGVHDSAVYTGRVLSECTVVAANCAPPWKRPRFARAVWTELGRIPYGETRTYGQLASILKNPKASRAVGAANGANPIPLIIPCHRVVASGGKLGGYAGGLQLKRHLLALERTKPQEDDLL